MEPFKKVFYTNSPEETIELGRQIGSRLKGGEIIAYKGGLGAGKTTITRGIALGMGLPDNVSSPTFSIVNEYHGSGLSLYHFDMYRISGGWHVSEQKKLFPLFPSAKIWKPRDILIICPTMRSLRLNGRRISRTSWTALS